MDSTCESCAEYTRTHRTGGEHLCTPCIFWTLADPSQQKAEISRLNKTLTQRPKPGGPKHTP